MNPKAKQQASGPLLSCLALGAATAILLAGAALATWAWLQGKQIQAIEREMETLQGRYEEIEGQARTLEERIAGLEAKDPTLQLADLQATVEAQGKREGTEEVQPDLAHLQGGLGSLEEELDVLEARLTALENEGVQPAESLPDEVRLVVARQKQGHNLSCESSAASMAAQYHGLSLSEEQVLAALPQHDNPHLGFRGNVDGPPGGTTDYGVYAGPITDLLEGQGLQATLVEGKLAGIRAALARGNPVIAWITYECQASTPIIETIEGQVVSLVPYQHTVVVTGYNPQGIWAIDPWDGQQDFYAAADFERAMGYFGHMAIEVAAP
jgi:uncharacterized protein YvpB